MCLSHAPAEDLHELTRAHTVNLVSSSNLLLCSKIQLCKVKFAFFNGKNYCQKERHFTAYIDQKIKNKRELCFVEPRLISLNCLSPYYHLSFPLCFKVLGPEIFTPLASLLLFFPIFSLDLGEKQLEKNWIYFLQFSHERKLGL